MLTKFQLVLNTMAIKFSMEVGNEESMLFNESNYDFLFCSEGTSNIYSLHKLDILEKIGKSKTSTLSLEELHDFLTKINVNKIIIIY